MGGSKTPMFGLVIAVLGYFGTGKILGIKSVPVKLGVALAG